jgi:hypothetical protein
MLFFKSQSLHFLEQEALGENVEGLSYCGAKRLASTSRQFNQRTTSFVPTYSLATVS